MRAIACMTATRADYPRVKAVLEEIRRRQELSLRLIVTGMHLERAFGLTVREIEADGFDIAARVPMYDGNDTPHDMARAVARVTAGIADALAAIAPDIFLITVDRVETLAAATAGALMNLPLAHIQGGEVTGTIDESLRHAVTKLSHIHFPATKDAARRIIRMGEKPEHVHAVGCPYIDLIQRLDYRSKADLAAQFGFEPDRPLIIFTQHPVTTEYGQAREQIRVTLEALECFPEAEIVAFHSNADAGCREIIAAMSRHKRLHLFPNVHERDFLSLMKCADVMVGNSSAGIREAPSMKLPAVNIGTRQQGRERAGNVIDVPHDIGEIADAIRRALTDKAFRKQLQSMTNPYGDGRAAPRIVDVLEAVQLGPHLIQKRITY